jgi:hypothetical protein
VPANPSDAQVPAVPLRDFMAGPRNDYWASWPVATQSDRVLVHNARNKEAKRLDDVLNQTLLLKGAIAHHATVEVEGGEMMQCVRVVLILNDGTTIAGVSDGLVASVRDLVTNFGEGPWPKPLPIIPRQVKTRKGYRTYKLEVDASADQFLEQREEALSRGRKAK